MLIESNVLKYILLLIFFAISACTFKTNTHKYYNSPSGQQPFEFDLSQVIRVDSFDVELLEWAIFEETNSQRRRLDLKPCKYERRLQQAARLHSNEMVDLNYFSHTSPVAENSTVRKRMSRAGIKLGTGGENIAIHPFKKMQDVVFKQTGTNHFSKYDWRNEGAFYTYREFAADLIQRWLNSPPHRQNILDTNFKFLGVGCVQAKFNQRDVFYVTQSFSSINY